MVEVADEGSCCDELGFRIAGGCGWSGGESCGGGSGDPTFLWVIVELIDNESGGCDTKITSNALGTLGDDPWQGELIVPGVELFASGTPITFSGENEEGTVYSSIEITKASMPGAVYRNPQAETFCSPCVCTMCIPSKICATITLIEDACGIGCDTFYQGIKLTYNEETFAYESTPIPCGEDEWTITLRVPNCEDRTPSGDYFACGLIGRIEGPLIAQTVDGLFFGDCSIYSETHGCIDFFYQWERRDEDPFVDIPSIDRVAQGDRCKENDYSTLVWGEDIRRKWAFGTIIRKDEWILPLTTSHASAIPKRTIGYLSIYDLCCGGKCPDEPINCVPGCPDIAPRVGLNLFPCPHVDLTATLIAPGCEYDGHTVTLKHWDVPLGGTVATPTPSGCVLWGGRNDFTCDNANAISIIFYLYDEVKLCSAPATAARYLLTWNIGAFTCDTGMSIAGQAYPDGEAECDPFVLEFTLPAFCMNNLIDPIYPICGDDPGCDSVTVRITL